MMNRLCGFAKATAFDNGVVLRSVTAISGRLSHTLPNGVTLYDNQKRYLTTPRENPLLPLTLGVGVAGCCLIAKYIVERADNYKNKTDGKGENTYAFANFYQGGFEPEMTKREAALILGVRVNSDPKRVQKAYRNILLKNHPDKGGSPYLAAKVNQAKDVLNGNQEAASS